MSFALNWLPCVIFLKLDLGDRSRNPRSNLRRMTQRVDEPLEEFAERTLKMASDGHYVIPGIWVQTLAVGAFLQGCVDKNSALSTMHREPQTVDEAMRLMKRFNSHEKSLLIDKRVRTLAFEERPPVNPQIKRVQERDSPAINVSELNESIGKLTKFIMGMSTREIRSGVLRCFRCNNEEHMARYCKMDACKCGEFYFCKVSGEKLTRATVRPHVAVKLNTEKVKDTSLAEMREMTVRTEKERCTLLVDHGRSVLVAVLLR